MVGIVDPAATLSVAREVISRFRMRLTASSRRRRGRNVFSVTTSFLNLSKAATDEDPSMRSTSVFGTSVSGANCVRPTRSRGLLP